MRYSSALFSDHRERSCEGHVAASGQIGAGRRGDHVGHKQSGRHHLARNLRWRQNGVGLSFGPIVPAVRIADR
ncbi:hypothetical protein D3C87_1710100 [compost metagenome]